MIVYSVKNLICAHAPIEDSARTPSFTVHQMATDQMLTYMIFFNKNYTMQICFLHKIISKWNWEGSNPCMDTSLTPRLPPYPICTYSFEMYRRSSFNGTTCKMKSRTYEIITRNSYFELSNFIFFLRRMR